MSEVKNILVIGSGTMGAGIAQVSALSGYDTILADLNQDLLDTAVGRVHKSLDKGVEKGKTEAAAATAAKARLTTATDAVAVASEMDLIIEAIPEKPELKNALFSSLHPVAKPTCIFATNTSSISVKDLAVASGRPENFCGMHFFNPPPILKLLELVTHEELNEGVLEQVKSVCDQMGRKTIVVNDSPGFATSRLAVAVAMEAIRMLEEGVASAEDIDTAMEVGYRWPMGPLKLTDHIGLDVRLDITSYLYEKLGRETFKPPELMKRLVAEGKTGAKSGQGFYSWND